MYTWSIFLKQQEVRAELPNRSLAEELARRIPDSRLVRVGWIGGTQFPPRDGVPVEMQPLSAIEPRKKAA
jgi:hypothetical protein